MKLPALRFDGQTVLVTGASSGIGRETALAFAAAGANVVLVARRAAALAKVASQARASGAEALSVATDVTNAAAVKACFRKAVQRFGRIDVVVNNAGILLPATVAEIDPADLQRMLDVNLFGALHVMQAAVRQMQTAGLRRSHRQHRVAGGSSWLLAARRLLCQQVRARRPDRDAPHRTDGQQRGRFAGTAGRHRYADGRRSSVELGQQKDSGRRRSTCRPRGSCGLCSRRSDSGWPKWPCRLAAHCWRNSARSHPALPMSFCGAQ